MLLSWRHSGFSVNNSVRMAGDDHKARVSLAQYIARAPLSLEKLHYDQQDGKAFYHSTYNPYLGENLKVWDALDFLALATSFIPPQGVRLIRYYGLYSSRSRWKWPLWQHVAAHAPLGWKRTHEQDSMKPISEPPTRTLPESASRSAWARLIAQVYEVNLIGGSCLRSKQREPLGLSPVRFGNASAGRHHRYRRGEEEGFMFWQPSRSGATGGKLANGKSSFFLSLGDLLALQTAFDGKAEASKKKLDSWLATRPRVSALMRRRGRLLVNAPDARDAHLQRKDHRVAVDRGCT